MHRSGCGAQHRAVRLILQYERPGADHAPLPQRDPVAKRCVDADEAAGAHSDVPRDDRVRGDEAVVGYTAVVPDVVAAPHDDVLADPHEWLDHIRLEHERVLADWLL